MDYDDWRVNGNWHKCVCGAQWSDSDGGPCHFTCAKCGEVVPCEEGHEKHDDLCYECGEEKEATDTTDEDSGEREQQDESDEIKE